MRPPEFWHRPCPSPAAVLLAPLGNLYALAGWLRRVTARPAMAPVPVICVGNLSLGGTGKTPVALALGGKVAARGREPHFLSRGYGGRLKGPVRVDPERHDPLDVGDEALLLAAAAPTWVSADRPAGARAAAAAGAQAIIMDDGFQNPTLRKDLSVLVIDGGVGLGNGLVFPAGPLREPAADGLARADAVLVMGEDVTGVADRIGTVPVLRGLMSPRADPADWAGRKVVAFAGIGRPDKFFDALRGLGAELIETRAFPDHHPYRPVEIEGILRSAATHDAMPVTTAKDAVRLPEPVRDRVLVLTGAVEWENEAALEALLDPLFGPG